MSGIRGKRLVGMRVYTCVAIYSSRLPDDRVVSIANEFSKERSRKRVLFPPDPSS